LEIGRYAICIIDLGGNGRPWPHRRYMPDVGESRYNHKTLLKSDAMD